MAHQGKLTKKEEHPRREVPWMDWTCLFVLISTLFLGFGVTFFLALVALLPSLFSEESYEESHEESHKEESGAVTFHIVPPCDQYMSNPHTESLSWVNALIAKMWISLRVMVKRDLKGFLETLMKKEAIKKSHNFITKLLLSAISVEELDVGPMCPWLTGAIAFTTTIVPEDDWRDSAPFGQTITIDIGFSIDLKPNIQISFLRILQAGLRELKMKGIAGIKINLLRDLGGIGNIGVYFLQPSTVKYRFDGLLSFMNWPRIQDCLQDLVNLAMKEYLVLPGHLTIPLAGYDEIKSQLNQLV